MIAGIVIGGGEVGHVSAFAVWMNPPDFRDNGNDEPGSGGVPESEQLRLDRRVGTDAAAVLKSPASTTTQRGSL